MQYPYNDDNMIFNCVTHRYVLTEKGVRAYAAVSLGESFKSDVANSITAFLNLASQQTYNIIHSYNVNTEVQDYIIATTKSGREMIQEAMINRLLFLLTERKIFDEAFYSVITRILPEINTSICYSGQVFRLDKPIKWEELDGEKESESSLVLIDKTITANGVYNANSEEVGGQTVDGYRMVEVDVQPNLQVGTGTVNGETYYPSQGYDGFSEFTVNIPVDTRVQHNIHLFGETNTDRLDCYFTITNHDRTNYSTMELLYNAMVEMNVGYSEQTAVDASGTYINNQVSHTIIKTYILKGATSGQIVYSPIAIDSDGATQPWLGSVDVTDTLISESAKLLEQKNITQNGLYAADDEGYDGYRSVYVNVPSRTPRLQSKTAQASSVQQVISYDTGYDGLRQVTIEAVSGTYSIFSNGEYDIAQYGKVSVNVETANIGAITGELTANGTYNASDYGLSGISSFTVNVPLLLQDKTVTITQNNTTEIITKDSRYNGLGTVTVNVAVPKDMKLKGVIDGSITETITAADLADLTCVRMYVFYKCKPIYGFSIELPYTIASDRVFDGSKGIGDYAFAESDLTSIKVENGGYFLPILNHAFYNCTMLTTVDLGNSILDFTIGGEHTHLFAECGTITNFIIRYPRDPLDPDILDESKTSGYVGENSNFENTTITNLYVPSEWVQYYTNVWQTQFGIAVHVHSLDEYDG